jgi:hypothetical protein
MVREPALITLRVKPDDALMLDNEFVLRVEPSARWKVTAAYRNPFLLKALAALPSVELAENAQIRITETSITYQPGPGIYFITPQPGAPAGNIVQWNTSHPVMRFVDAGLWALVRYTVLSPPPDAVALMETSQGPVGYAQQSDQGRRIVLGFKLEDSNLYQLAGLPVFLQNAIQWIEEDLQKQLPSLTGPSIHKEGAFQDGAGHQGYANFADDVESRILPGRPVGLSQSGTQQLPRKQDISRWFLILAVSIVILEWWAFHRRMEL